MSLGDRINEIRKQKGLSIDDLSSLSGVPKGTLSKITAGITPSPTLATVKAIAKALGCRLDDLDDYDDRSVRTALNYGEFATLIKKYRALDERGKEIVNTILDHELERIEEINHLRSRYSMEAASESPSALIRLRRSYQPASAGTGMFLGSDDFETIYVLDHPLLRRAAFAVPVTGNSMEPDYHDGDTLLVESAPDIRVGEIGVFTMGGQGYIKKRGEAELISLNPKYEPIPLDESIRCNGRVIGILDPDWIVEQ